jgi:hypothetical protein
MLGMLFFIRVHNSRTDTYPPWQKGVGRRGNTVEHHDRPGQEGATGKVRKICREDRRHEKGRASQRDPASK